jgi:antitoxin (DNA-binding transcriptional repressor) of toxin-antitoxin stability system
MTTEVSVQEAEAQLPELIARAEAGEEIVICRAKPVVRLSAVPAASQPPSPRQPRVLGRFRDQIWIAEDFNELPDELLDAFEGNAEARRQPRVLGRDRGLFVVPDDFDEPIDFAEVPAE